MRETINHTDSQGFNCLYYATYHGHLEVVKLLKKVGINYSTDAKGTSCLHIAITRGNLAIVDFLLTRTIKRAVEGELQPNLMGAQDRNKARQRELEKQ